MKTRDFGKPNEASLFCTTNTKKLKGEVLRRSHYGWNIVGFFERKIPESFNFEDRETCMMLIRHNPRKEPYNPKLGEHSTMEEAET